MITSIIIPVAAFLVGILAGGAGAYAALRAKVASAINARTIAQTGLRCFSKACDEILSDAFKKKVGRRYAQLVESELEKIK